MAEAGLSSKPSNVLLLRSEIEQCRKAWATERNFAALVVALACCQEADTFPEWVHTALQTIIENEIDAGVDSEMGRWFKNHKQDVIDFVRADFIRNVRLHGFTWEEASACCAEYYGPTPAGRAGPAAMMKSWQRFNKSQRAAPRACLVTT